MTYKYAIKYEVIIHSHFEALADALAAVSTNDDMSQQAQWEADVEAVASVCAELNPNFDREKFLARASR